MAPPGIAIVAPSATPRPMSSSTTTTTLVPTIGMPSYYEDGPSLLPAAAPPPHRVNEGAQTPPINDTADNGAMLLSIITSHMERLYLQIADDTDPTQESLSEYLDLLQVSPPRLIRQETMVVRFKPPE